ncbi:MAG: M13 family metallopeptidase [Kofleriaceae bacterium]
MHRRLALLLIVCVACKSRTEPTPVREGSGSGGSATTAQTPAAPAKKSGLDLAAIDKSVAPGDDFDAYANGAWNKVVEIPADRASFGVGAQVSELTAKRNAELIQDAAANAPAGSEARKVGDYYASFMDEAGIEAKGWTPLQPQLDAIEKITDTTSLSHALGDTVRADVDAINATDFETPNVLGLWVAQDFADPLTYSPFLLQGGLLLPDREFYLSTKPDMVAARAAYEKHIEKMLSLIGVPETKKKAKAILDLETRIAKTHATRQESADVKRGLTHWKREDFAKKAPGMDWAAFFSAAGLGEQPAFVVWHPSAVTGIAALVTSQPLPVWKDYLSFHALEAAAPYLSKAFVDESFAFFGTALSGTPAQRERWKRAIDDTTDALGDAVGKLYVAKYFPASEKARAQAMVQKILEAFGKRVDALTWMSPETKRKAKAKLAVLRVGVGYPDTWRDYAKLEIVKGDALGNADHASRFELAHQLAKLGKPVDRGEWMMVAHLVNAVNLPAMNAMNFPAAILQPPYFDPARPEVMDYGAIGAVIGHEISHSFDDQGALFDATGRLANWWTEDDFAHFAESGAALAKQYDGYKPFPDLALNGKLLLSENIADVAGIAAAYDASKLLPSPPVWEGLSPDQQFFLAYAQMWRLKIRPEALRANLVTATHSPGPYRSATVRNLDAWYDAFDVKPGNARYLAPAERVRVW